ncbi:hypothetical protein C7379_13412 [Hallella colorans]|uniref:Uncharacterized protein n=1 Tax=Hallella colorans TaxID=1703337 RepID=A0A2U0TK74_9BACT|nr:hypothetical protein C7379_13412 [Hallella colorans]
MESNAHKPHCIEMHFVLGPYLLFYLLRNLFFALTNMILLSYKRVFL